MSKFDYEVDKLRNKRKSKIEYGICSICSENRPLVKKEDHHVDGKINSDYTTKLCIACHSIPTEAINSLPSDIRSGKTELDRTIVMLTNHTSLTEHICKMEKEQILRLEVFRNELNSSKGLYKTKGKEKQEDNLHN